MSLSSSSGVFLFVTSIVPNRFAGFLLLDCFDILPDSFEPFETLDALEMLFSFELSSIRSVADLLSVL